MQFMRVLCILAVFAPSAAKSQIASSSFFCAAEFVGGLAYNVYQKHWESATFTPTQKFVLTIKVVSTRVEDSESIDDLIVTVTPSGSSFAAPCSRSGGAQQSTIPSMYGLIQCVANVTEYTINRRNNRFLASYSYGYINGKDNNDDTPTMSGGTCTKIN